MKLTRKQTIWLFVGAVIVSELLLVVYGDNVGNIDMSVFMANIQGRSPKECLPDWNCKLSDGEPCYFLPCRTGEYLLRLKHVNGFVVEKEPRYRNIFLFGIQWLVWSSFLIYIMCEFFSPNVRSRTSWETSIQEN